MVYVSFRSLQLIPEVLGVKFRMTGRQPLKLEFAVLLRPFAL